MNFENYLSRLYIAATKLPETDRYMFLRVKFEPNSITFTPMSEEWFRQNPKKLPGTVELPVKGSEEKRIELTATPELLSGFLMFTDQASLWQEKAAYVFKKIR